MSLIELSWTAKKGTELKSEAEHHIREIGQCLLNRLSMTKLVFIHVPIRNMYFLSGMEGFKKSEGRSTRGASSLQNWLRPPPQNWLRPYVSYSSAPTALMKKLSTANLLSIHVLILRIFVFGGATRIVGAGSRQSQIGLSKGVLSANPLPGASGLGKLTSS